VSFTVVGRDACVAGATIASIGLMSFGSIPGCGGGAVVAAWLIAVLGGDANADRNGE
jgi:hypothetical protein